jgi:putative sporulation protein YtxC
VAILAIGTSKENHSATEQLANCLKVGGLEFEIANLGQWIFLGCKLAGERTVESHFLRAFVADAVADLLVGPMQGELITKILRHNYKGFTPQEREKIIARSMEILNFDSETGQEDTRRRRQRRNLVYARLMECLAGRPQIVLEGFVRFRLKEYYRELTLAVDLAVEEHMAEREYRDFISLLRSFVEIQPPQFDLLHVICKKSRYFLLDGQGEELGAEFLEEPLPGMEEEDLLLSNLITLAPGAIVLHIPQEMEISQTIIQVFEEHVAICQGCNLCH